MTPWLSSGQTLALKQRFGGTMSERSCSDFELSAKQVEQLRNQLRIECATRREAERLLKEQTYLMLQTQQDINCIASTLTDREHQLRRWLELTDEACMSISSRGHIVGWNPAAERLTGLDASFALHGAADDIVQLQPSDQGETTSPGPGHLIEHFRLRPAEAQAPQRAVVVTGQGRLIAIDLVLVWRSQDEQGACHFMLRKRKLALAQHDPPPAQAA